MDTNRVQPCSVPRRPRLWPISVRIALRDRALVLEVYRHKVQQLAEATPALLASHLPLEALRTWMDRLAHYGIKAGLAVR
jgi:hypothetical protein